MLSARWKVEVALLGLGTPLVVAVWLVWPGVSLSMAKQGAMDRLAGLDDRSRASMNLVPAPDVQAVPSAGGEGERLGHSADGWRFSLPAERYRRCDDPNRPNVLEGPAVTVHIGGAVSQTPSFARGAGPGNDEVWRYFQQTDAYEMLCDAFATTPADVQAARSHAELQKALYLLLVRSFAQPVGSGRQWLRLEVAGRKGFLAGDAASRLIHVSIYLPETGQFAGIGIAPHEGATMADVYRCLGEMTIQREADAGLAAHGLIVPGLRAGAP